MEESNILASKNKPSIKNPFIKAGVLYFVAAIVLFFMGQRAAATHNFEGFGVFEAVLWLPFIIGPAAVATVYLIIAIVRFKKLIRDVQVTEGEKARFKLNIWLKRMLVFSGISVLLYIPLSTSYIFGSLIKIGIVLAPCAALWYLVSVFQYLRKFSKQS